MSEDTKDSTPAEGEIRADRAESGLNQAAGHEGDLATWEKSAEGQAFLAKEAERVKKEKSAPKAKAEDKAPSESERKYVEKTETKAKG